MTDVALEVHRREERGEKPWLLFVSWILPHSPYKAPDGYREHFSNITIPPNVPPGAATEYAEQCLPDYYGMIESLDDEFGRILEAVEKAGVADDTIVVFSSDHGDMIGSQGLKAKRWPYEESARIPLLIRYPRSIKPGTVIADPIGSPDIYPTLAGLAGVEAAGRARRGRFLAACCEARPPSRRGTTSISKCPTPTSPGRAGGPCEPAT